MVYLIKNPEFGRSARFAFPGLACLFLSLLSHTAGAPAFDAIYTFGDSLTDTGNHPSDPDLYYQSRFSNGPLWIEYFSENLGIPYDPNHNLAVSTSTTEEALTQVRRFIPPENLGNSLCIVWAGGNDFLNGLVNGLDPIAWGNTVSAAVSHLSECVELLYSDGARAIVVPNAVDYSRVPGSALFPPIYQATIRTYVQSFNTSLRAKLDLIAGQHSDLSLKVFDVTGLFDEILVNPGPFGFTNTNLSALQDPNLSDKSFNGPGKDDMFWDLVHPTSKTHSLVAERMVRFLRPPLRIAARVVAGNLVLSFRGLNNGASYSVERSVDLKTWTSAERIIATADTYDWSPPSGDSSTGFFRVRLRD